MKASSQRASKGKGTHSAFYRPQNVAHSRTLSEDGRRFVTSSHVLTREVPLDVTEPAPTPGTTQSCTPSFAYNTLRAVAADPAFDAAESPAEPVEGLKGISVVTQAKSKRYASSVRGFPNSTSRY